VRRSLALLALLGLVLTGCGGDDGSITAKDAAETTVADDGTDDGNDDAGDADGPASGAAAEILASLLDSDVPIDEADARCAAEAMAEDLSTEGVALMGDAESSPSDLSAADAEVVRVAFNDCVPFEALGSLMVDGLAGADGLFQLTDDERSCSLDALEEQMGGTGDLIFAMEDMSEDDGAMAIFDAVGGCVSKETLVPALAQLLNQDGSLDEATATCVSDALVTEFGGTDLLRNFMQVANGAPSADFQTAVEQAALAC